MKSKMLLTHEFVEYIPDELKDGTIYASMAYATVAHRCCCGCGREVVTPLSPTDWNFPCRSHYMDKTRWGRMGTAMVP